jgi:signal transduction histidine kinase
MGNLGLRSALTALLWLAVLGTIVALHRVQPPDSWRAAQEWTATPRDPPGAAKPVRLPHRWAPDGPRRMHYAAAVALAEISDEPWVVYLPSLNLNAALHVNGVAIGSGGNMEEPLARHRYRPLLFYLPAGVLRPGHNELAVEVVAQTAGTGFLQQAYLGPQSQLRPFFELRAFLKVQFLYGLSVAVAMLGTIMLVVWSGRREERAFLWYAVTSAAFVVYTLHFAVANPPLPSIWWDWLYSASVTAFVAAITVFGIHFLGLRQPRLVRLLAWFTAAGLVSLALIGWLRPEAYQFWSARVWHSIVLAFGVYPVSLFVRELWRRSDARSFWMLASATSLLVGGAHDVLLNNRLIDPYAGNYLGYMVPLPIAVFTWIMLERFLAALRESEMLNRELNQRVLQKQAELERSYETLRKLEQQQLLVEERERIQRDMHDGLGGTLVSALAGMEMQGEQESAAARSLRSALDDLRLMIYSLDQDGGTLRAALGMLRERLRRLADDTGLAVQWSMQELPADKMLDRGATLQLMRIVQEAFTNTLKHARAANFEFTARLQEREGCAGVELVLRDDGAGYEPGGAQSGSYGLSNMRVRAQKIGGRIDMHSAPGAGCRITLWVPLA